MQCPVLKIHGCVHHPESIVLSRNACVTHHYYCDCALLLTITVLRYKRLKHETPGYKMFLTTAMATSTMLYIGFSFTDDYLNDFRAEVLSMLRPRRSLQSGPEKGSFVTFRSACQDKVPIGYGIIEGRSKQDCSFFRYSPPFLSFVYFQRIISIALLLLPQALHTIVFLIVLPRRHEGVQIMTWKPDYEPPTSISDKQTQSSSQTLWHNGLDVYLQSIFRRTHKNYIDGQMLTENFFSSRRC
jgi:hypothetical protein